MTLDNLLPGPGQLLDHLLFDPKCVVEVGGIYRLDFNEALVLTADHWRNEAGGIPQFCFLLATARQVHQPGGATDDDEALLLRVDGTAELAQEKEILGVREEALRDALVKGRAPEVEEILRLDPYTRNRISFTGLRCTILGTFYEEVVDGNVRLAWGSDIDNFYASSTYRVYKPYGDVLSLIASYIRPTTRDPMQVRIGHVRYSSTTRRSTMAGHEDAAVKINVKDFIGQKTGMFGMTRMGKSNSMKTIVTQVFIAAQKSGEQIGQLIFDPQGEYANVNPQDKTALAAIGERHIRIYAFGADPSTQGGHVRPLGINFFDPQQIFAVQGIIHRELIQQADADYIKAFGAAELHAEEGDYGGETTARFGRLLLYGSLIKAEFALPKRTPGTNRPYTIPLTMAGELANDINKDHGRDIVKKTNSKTTYLVEGDDIIAVCDWLVANEDHQAFAKHAKKATWEALKAIYEPSGYQRGWRYLNRLRKFHNPHTEKPVANEIYEDLLEGRIVIVDLHLGPRKIIQPLSEEIVNHLIREQTERFASGSTEDLPKIQVVVEEAHNLFKRDNKNEDDPWVTLAKEAAKLSIGLVYATQEVTGVDPQVLANTKNWVVAHLNNSREVNELSRYYDFDAFGDAIIKSEDRGYVRMKTESSPYIIPVQIDLFGPEMINEAREAAGEPALEFDSGGN